MFSIGQFSKITGISIPTLRYYDERGLIVPEVKMDNGYRYYVEDQLLHAQFVNNLKNVGLSLEAIEDLINTRDPAYTLQRISELKYAKMNEIKQLIDIENYYARGVLSENHNSISEETVEFCGLSRCEYLFKEIGIPDAKHIFTFDCMQLQKQRDELGLIQTSGMRIICKAFDSNGRDILAMPVSPPAGISASGNGNRGATEVMNGSSTISAVICRETMDYEEDVRQLAGVAESLGYTVKGTPVIECLLDPGDIPDTNQYIARLHLIIE